MDNTSNGIIRISHLHLGVMNQELRNHLINVLEWWEEHQYDVSRSGCNAYDTPPEFVKSAISVLNRELSPVIMSRFQDIDKSLSTEEVTSIKNLLFMKSGMITEEILNNQGIINPNAR